MFEVPALQHIVNVAAALMHSEFASMELYDPNRKALRLICHQGFDPLSAVNWKWVYPDTPTTSGLSLRLRRQIVVSDVLSEAQTMRDAYLPTGIRAAQTTPLMDGNSLLGMISTHWSTPHRPTPRKLHVFDLWAHQTAHSLAKWGRALEAIREAEAQVKWSKELIAKSEQLITMLKAKREAQSWSTLPKS